MVELNGMDLIFAVCALCHPRRQHLFMADLGAPPNPIDNTGDLMGFSWSIGVHAFKSPFKQECQH